MSEQVDDTTFAITDPGEKNRAQHLWGDRLMIGIGNVVAWIFPVLMLGIVIQVVIRKMGFNQAWLDDAQWWMYGFAMLTGFGYAITTNSHVRVDIFHQHFSAQKAARIEVFALGWLLMPFLVLMIDIMCHYSWSSWVAGEGSDSPNGLHKLYLLKLSLPVLFLAAAIATWSALFRNLGILTRASVWKMVFAAFPASWFIAERAIYYVLWWLIHLTKPDIIPRKISREPLLEHSTSFGLTVLLVFVLIAFTLSSRRNKE
ncbi:MAG TPA: TRAP transporter permease DctQ [Rhodobacteraceae bacterium]|nr:TRAP transporter permease DctQ [Paracoccaceae bacterium]